MKCDYLLYWTRFTCSVPWATSGLTDSTGTVTGTETQLPLLLGLVSGQLLGGDSWGGLRGEGLRRSVEHPILDCMDGQRPLLGGLSAGEHVMDSCGIQM